MFLITLSRWLAGDCRFGSRCNFAHGSHELRKVPPKPGRYSQDTRDRRLEKEEQFSGYPPYAGYHNVSFDTAYRNFRGQSVTPKIPYFMNFAF